MNTNIVALRKKHRMNQSEFWATVGVTQSGGSRYESGRAIPKPVKLLLDIAFGRPMLAGRVVRKLRRE